MTIATVDLEEQDVDEYYNGYANRTLWPLFHYRVDLAEFDRNFGSGYERVNQRFASTAVPLIEPDDIIWVQDYHLIPLGEQLRLMGVTNRIGYLPPHPVAAASPADRLALSSPPGAIDARLRPDRLPDRAVAGKLPPLCRRARWAGRSIPTAPSMSTAARSAPAPFRSGSTSANSTIC